MKSFDERLREHLLKSDTPSKLSFEEGAYWSERQHEKWCLGAWITGIMGGITLTFIGFFFYNVHQSKPETCTCRFAQHRVHFGDQYTKTNRKCIDLGNGSVQTGDTVYLDVKWFTNECD